MAAPLIRPGTIIDAKYEVRREIGGGGMGVVVEAVHIQLDEVVALKFLRPEHLSNDNVVARFRREGRAAARLRSEHICRARDLGESPAFGPFIVMDHLTGEDLGDHQRRLGPLPVDVAVGYLLQAMAALAEAHVRGIVHRDLKPANLFLTRRPDGSTLVKILDFGISKMPVDDPSHPVHTNTRMMMGSTPYMAPEQARNIKQADARSDIWSLGVTLHKLVTGRMPFEADSQGELLARIVGDPPVPLRTHRPDLPAELEAVVLRCLDKDPARRFASVADLATALAPFAPEAAPVVRSIQSLVRRRIAAEEQHPRFTDPTVPPPRESLPDSADLDTAEWQRRYGKGPAVVTERAEQGSAPITGSVPPTVTPDIPNVPPIERPLPPEHTRRWLVLAGGAAVAAAIAVVLSARNGGSSPEPVDAAAVPAATAEALVPTANGTVETVATAVLPPATAQISSLAPSAVVAPPPAPPAALRPHAEGPVVVTQPSAYPTTVPEPPTKDPFEIGDFD